MQWLFDRPEDQRRRQEVCQSCGAVGYGNLTCAACVREWPRFGIASQEDADKLLAAIGDKPPEPPFGTRFQ